MAEAAVADTIDALSGLFQRSKVLVSNRGCRTLDSKAQCVYE